MQGRAGPLSDVDRLEERVLQMLKDGNRQVIGELFEIHRARLLRVVHLRLNPRLRQRVEPADVMQETFLIASNRIDEFLRQDRFSFFVWLRFLAIQKVVDCHREHVGTLKRSIAREVTIEHPSSAQLLANNLLAKPSTPCEKAMRVELRDRLTQVLEEIPDLDRDILVLRHFEQLTNQEVAETLKMNPSTVSTRHVRALGKLRGLLVRHSEFRDRLSEDFK